MVHPLLFQQINQSTVYEALFDFSGPPPDCTIQISVENSTSTGENFVEIFAFHLSEN